METRDRVLIIGDVTSGFRIHGPFSDNAEAFAYAKRHAERFPSEGWAGNTLALKLVNFDRMTETEISKYERQVGDGWASLRDLKTSPCNRGSGRGCIEPRPAMTATTTNRARTP
jgi:hypothetical protein